MSAAEARTPTHPPSPLASSQRVRATAQGREKRAAKPVERLQAATPQKEEEEFKILKARAGTRPAPRLARQHPPLPRRARRAPA